MNKNTEKKSTFAVLGAGSWGTALAILLARHGYSSHLWGLRQEIATLKQERQNQLYLPGILFPELLMPDESLETVANCKHILVAVPSHAFRPVLQQLVTLKHDIKQLAWATKGVEPGGGKLLSEVAAELLPQAELAVLSGPTFAAEVGKGYPTAIAVASPSTEFAKLLAHALTGGTFRAYMSHDLIGAQVGGACKNIMAIGAGISDGLGFGANARAALITRGLAEIARLGQALGAHQETFMGLAGIGDLVLTCTDNQSRNRRLGLALAHGLSIAEAKAEIHQEIEGIATTRAIHAKALQLSVEMPITHQIHRILLGQLTPEQAVKELLHRNQRAEGD